MRASFLQDIIEETPDAVKLKTEAVYKFNKNLDKTKDYNKTKNIIEKYGNKNPKTT